MASKELKKEICDLIADRMSYGSMDVMCDEILSIILATANQSIDALVQTDNPGEYNQGLFDAMEAIQALSASPLGEQSE